MIPANSLVFLIDDDASVRKGVSRLLRSAGYKNETFVSASDFLAREQHHGPACLIVDVRMPGLNGMDLQTALIQRRREEQLCLHYRPRRHLHVCAGDEGWRSGFSSKAVSGQRIAAMCRARAGALCRATATGRGESCGAPFSGLVNAARIRSDATRD